MMRTFSPKTIAIAVLFVLLSLCAFGCQSADRLSDGGSLRLYANDGGLEESKGSDPSDADGIAQLPQQEGGAEIDVRPLQPASNKELQRKYPNIVVLRGSLAEKKAALTFDDGPDLTYTPQVLDILNKHGVKATFFLMGARAAALPNMTRRIVEEGHVVGNHTYWHPQLYAESLERVHWEVTSTDDVLEQIIGYRPKLFRAPYGGLTEPIVEMLGEMNYSVIGWTVDSEDWKQLDAETVKRNVIDHMHPGAIVLFHSGGHWTQDLGGMTEALDEIIPYMQELGYEWVTVPELIGVNESRA